MLKLYVCLYLYACEVDFVHRLAWRIYVTKLYTLSYGLDLASVNAILQQFTMSLLCCFTLHHCRHCVAPFPISPFVAQLAMCVCLRIWMWASACGIFVCTCGDNRNSRSLYCRGSKKKFFMEQLYFAHLHTNACRILCVMWHSLEQNMYNFVFLMTPSSTIVPEDEW